MIEQLRNRTEAGQLLAKKLTVYANRFELYPMAANNE
jgi:hypothetical protein